MILKCHSIELWRKRHLGISFFFWLFFEQLSKRLLLISLFVVSVWDSCNIFDECENSQLFYLLIFVLPLFRLFFLLLSEPGSCQSATSLTFCLVYFAFGLLSLCACGFWSLRKLCHRLINRSAASSSVNCFRTTCLILQDAGCSRASGSSCRSSGYLLVLPQ